MEDKYFPTIKNAILLCLLWVIMNLGIGFLIGLCQIMFNISSASPIVGLLYIFTGAVSFGVVLLIGIKKSKRSINAVFKFRKISPYFFITATILVIGLSIILSEIDNLLNFIIPMPDWLRGVFVTLMVEQPLIISIIYIGLIAAFGEELFFRGLILDGFSRNYSRNKAIIVSAILFGLIHLNPWQFVTTFIFELVWALICIKTKSIILCIYMHLLNNVGAVIMVRLCELVPIRGYNVLTESVEFQSIWFTLSGVIILAIGILMLIHGFYKIKIIA